MNREITNLEFGLLVMNSIVAIGAIGAFVWRFLERTSALPDAIAFGSGLFAIMLLIYPVVSINLRRARQLELPFYRYALGSLAGAVVGSGITYLL